MWKKGLLKIRKGDRYGRLTILEEVERGRKPCGQPFRRFLCKCDCGNTKIVPLFCLRQGYVRSCGCLGDENRRTSQRKYPERAASSRLYKIWANMRGRCYDPNLVIYRNYGGRGITVCDEWREDFLPFYNWAKNNGYSNDLSLDRINNNGNYEPSNCRWATRLEQQNNRRNNVFLTLNNERHTLSEWSRLLNIPYNALLYRRKKGFNVEEILNPETYKRHNL